jgi:hypothetical protein
MNWQEILVILVPILSLLAWTYARIDKKFELVDKKFEQLTNKMVSEFEEVKKALHSLDMRLTRLEGRFDERGYWESRKTGTYDEKG